MGAVCARPSRSGKATMREWSQARYCVVVSTSKRFEAGTDANVFVRLHGASRASEEHQLTRSIAPKRLHERGAVDVFLLDEDDLGDIQAVSLRNDGSATLPDWHVHSVRVIHMMTFDEWDVPVGRWVTESEPADELPVHVKRAAAEGMLHNVASVVAGARTGDVLLLTTGELEAHVEAATGRAAFTHAGVVVVDAETGRARVFEACDNFDDTPDIASADVYGGVHAFDLTERVATFRGESALLPLGDALSAEAAQAVEDFCRVQHYERTPYCSKVCVANAHVASALKALGIEVPRTRINPVPLVARALKAAGVLRGDVGTMSELVEKECFGSLRPLVDDRTEQAVPAALLDRIETGDVLLFSSSNLFGRLVQLASLSMWDHVAVVVRRDNELFLFEATGVGVKVFEWEERMRNPNFKTIAVRHLHFPRESDKAAAVDALVEELNGKKYEQCRVELCKSIVKLNKKENLASVFCSELVAEALQRLGVLSTAKKSNNYAPYHFASDTAASIELLEHATLHKEVFIKH